MFSKRLKKLRTEKQITQLELASILHVSEASISLYENGKRTPKFGTLLTISKYFNCSIDYILGTSKSEKLSNNEVSTRFNALNEKDTEFVLYLINRLIKT